MSLGLAFLSALFSFMLSPHGGLLKLMIVIPDLILSGSNPVEKRASIPQASNETVGSLNSSLRPKRISYRYHMARDVTRSVLPKNVEEFIFQKYSRQMLGEIH